MIEVRVDESFRFHFLVIEEVIGGAEVSLCKIILSSPVPKEQVRLGSLLYINYSRTHKMLSYVTKVYVRYKNSYLNGLHTPFNLYQPTPINNRLAKGVFIKKNYWLGKL